MKRLYVTMPNQEVWTIPAQYVAEDRAAYYAKKDVESGDATDYDETFAEEVAYAMDDQYELIDWASNNMDWDDVKEHAELIDNKTNPAMYAKWWSNAEKVVRFDITDHD